MFIWVGSVCPVRWGLPSSCVMLLIGLKSDVQVVLCQYVVFILKLILSYLPVHLTDSSCPPLAHLVADIAELIW